MKSLPSIVCSLYGNKYNPLDDLLTLLDLLLDSLQLLLEVGDLLIVLEQEDLIGDRLDSGAALLDAVLRIRNIHPGSRILILPIPDPGSRIPDPKTATKERGEKKFVVIHF